jgi:pyruvate dehydrogenase E2 component (dihydrolipoamide acetyltransferase)
MSVFKLPDLGEGLQEAEITEWHANVGDEVQVDAPLLSVETAKAIVEIPSPEAGRIVKRWGEPGEVLPIGAPLVEFESADARNGGGDAGTVVGQVEASDRVANEMPAAVGKAATGIKAVPAVRALARRLEVDLTVVTPTGANDTITADDVKRVARIFKEVGPLVALRGARRAMAASMSQAHAEVVAVTVVEDADVTAWPARENPMLRLIRSIVAACEVQPELNAWYDGHAVGRRILAKIDLGIAMDSDDGLFVPVLRDVGNRGMDDLRRGLDAIKADVLARSIPPDQMRGHTFTLSNFGTFGGRYADPIVVPPTVAILGAGRIRDAVMAVDGAPAVRRCLPLSLSFDHRAITGGEATRFLMAAIRDLERGD